MWDVVTVYDESANQEGVPLRITGIKLVYDHHTPRYYLLSLGAA